MALDMRHSMRSGLGRKNKSRVRPVKEASPLVNIMVPPVVTSTYKKAQGKKSKWVDVRARQLG